MRGIILVIIFLQIWKGKRFSVIENFFVVHVHSQFSENVFFFFFFLFYFIFLLTLIFCKYIYNIKKKFFLSFLSFLFNSFFVVLIYIAILLTRNITHNGK